MSSALLLTLVAVLVPGFEPAMTAAGMAHWVEQPVGYRLHQAGSDDLSDGSDLAAARASFDTWSNLPSAVFAFRFDGLTNLTATAGAEGSEGTNLVVWRENPAEWVADGNSPLYYAVTTLSFDRCSGALVDADIEVNGGYHSFSTSDTAVSVDIQNVLTHEVGHVLGLDHSSDPLATMFARAGSGELGMRTLTDDDRAGVAYLYPADGDPPWLEQHDDCGGGCSLTWRSPGSVASFGVLAGLIGLALVRRRVRP